MSLALPTHARSDNIRGILAMLASMAVFVVNDTLMKIAAGNLPTGRGDLPARGVHDGAVRRLIVAAARRGLPHALSPTVLSRAPADVGRHRHLPERARAHADGRRLRHPAVHAAGDHGRRRAVPGRPGRLAAMDRDLRRPHRRAAHRAARAGRAFTPYALLAIVSVLFSAARDLLSRSVAPEVPPLVIVTHLGRRRHAGKPRLHRCSRPGRWPSSATVTILLVASVALLARPVLAGCRHAHRRDRRGRAVPLFDYPLGHPGGLSGLARACRTCHPGSASPSSRQPVSTPSCASSGWRGLTRA